MSDISDGLSAGSGTALPSYLTDSSRLLQQAGANSGHAVVACAVTAISKALRQSQTPSPQARSRQTEREQKKIKNYLIPESTRAMKRDSSRGSALMKMSWKAWRMISVLNVPSQAFCIALIFKTLKIKSSCCCSHTNIFCCCGHSVILTSSEY